ncbi:MAG: glycosyltransferase family 2 protein [Fibromonadaceae bacterium]|jgi:glycosyltransferase involved in cell wall biosynthesis|nr:glycosyltransferase family 2 protein [Fibromonadaceae bacterium]
MNSHNIYIWGTDKRAILTGLDLEQQHLQIKAFIDPKADEIGTRIGLPVMSPSDIIYEDIYIYIASAEYHELLKIGNFLESKGLVYGKEQVGFEFLPELIYDKDKFKRNSIKSELPSEPLISVIVPVYNVELYLPQCLDSIINQTYENLQIICVYDGSTDNSLQILQQYANKDTRIEIINKKSGCLGSARNFAYPYIKGKYTLFVDSDDYIDVDTCRKSVAVAEHSDADITLFFWNAEMKLNSGTTIFLKQYQFFPDSKTKITIEEKMSVMHFTDMWNKLWRSDFLKENKLLCPEYIAYEAILPSWKGLILANKVAVVEDVLCHYRVVGDSMTGKLNSTNIDISKHQFDFLYTNKLILDFLDKSGYFDKYGIEYIEWYIGTCFGIYDKRTPEAVKPLFLQQIFLSLSEEEKEFYRKHKFSTNIIELLTKYFGDRLG